MNVLVLLSTYAPECYTPLPGQSRDCSLPPTGFDDSLLMLALFVAGCIAVCAGVVFLGDRLTKWWRP